MQIYIKLLLYSASENVFISCLLRLDFAFTNEGGAGIYFGINEAF